MSSARRSAGLLAYRRGTGGLEVYLVHPGGPFWKNRDAGAWSIPKGEFDDDADDPRAAAIREFEEEICRRPPGDARFIDLGEIKQRGGKRVRCWGFEAPDDFDDDAPIESNTFEMEWPPKSGRTQSFPEVDRARFFDLETAREKINPAQAAFLDRLVAALE